MRKECPVCNTEFEGRPNKIYCRTRCRSEQGNKKYAAQHENEITHKNALSNNRKILANMYNMVGSIELPISVFDNAGFDKTRYTGYQKDGFFLPNTYFMCFEYTVQIIGTEFFKIIKK